MKKLLFLNKKFLFTLITYLTFTQFFKINSDNNNQYSDAKDFWLNATAVDFKISNNMCISNFFYKKVENIKNIFLPILNARPNEFAIINFLDSKNNQYTFYIIEEKTLIQFQEFCLNKNLFCNLIAKNKTELKLSESEIIENNKKEAEKYILNEK